MGHFQEKLMKPTVVTVPVHKLYLTCLKEKAVSCPPFLAPTEVPEMGS